MPQTNPRIIFIVIVTAAIMTLTFFITLASLVFVMPHVAFANDQASVMFDKVFSAFITAGMSAMSFFFGTLVNTRSNTTDPIKTDATIVNTDNNPAKTQDVKTDPNKK